jgi:hypothetical protein
LLLTLFSLSPLLLCSPAAVHAQWTPDVRLTYDFWDSNTTNSNAYSIGVNGNTVHVVWSDTRLDVNNPQIYYKRSTNGGLNWGPDRRLTDRTPLTWTGYPALAVSGQNVHLVWADELGTPQYYADPFYMMSTDDGITWQWETRLAFSPHEAGNPCIAASGNYVYALWSDYWFIPERHCEVYYSYSTNGGQDWFPAQWWAGDHSGTPSVAVSGNYVYTIWMIENPNPGIYFKWSADGGLNWSQKILTQSPAMPGVASITASGSDVYVVWEDARSAQGVYYMRSEDYGATWIPQSPSAGYHLPDAISNQYNPSVAAAGSDVHVTWVDYRNSGFPFLPEPRAEIFYKGSQDRGLNWTPDTRLTYVPIVSSCPSVAVSGSDVHVAWTDWRDGTHPEVYYKRSGFYMLMTDFSNGRHLVRDPSRGMLHLVMRTEGDTVFYARSLDDGLTWSSPQPLGLGKYPTVGLVQLPWAIWPPLMVVSVAYTSSDGTQLLYQWNDGTSDPGAGAWHAGTIPLGGINPGAPSLITGGDEYVGQGVFVAYAAGPVGSRQLFCNRFWFSDPTNTSVIETIDNGSLGSPDQPCLAVDGNLAIYAAWRRSTNNGEIWFAPRQRIDLDPPPPIWDPSTRRRVDQTGDPSQQPFIECYGDHAYVAWSDDYPSHSDVWRAGKHLPDDPWAYDNVCEGLPSALSESPTQAGSEFTTWAEGTGGGMFDNYYWRASNTERNPVLSNPTWWSYWPHSQMWNGWFWDTHLVSAWTESPNANNPPYTVLTHHLYWGFGGGGGGGFLSEPSGDKGAYYKVVTGLDSLSPYCKKRDGVMRFGDKSVDYARDSLIYELPYLDPMHDYLVKVSSYRETGANWAQALSVNGKTVRSVQFAPNKVDTAWFKIPPSAYARDRKVVFSLRNVKGDYVTSLGLILYQRDPRRGKGGPQIGETAVLPVREVFAVYPNPMSNQALIEFSLTSPGKVDLSVYDVTGSLVRRIVDAPQPAGVHKVTWDGCDQVGRRASSGIYFVRLTSPEKVKTARVVVVR